MLIALGPCTAPSAQSAQAGKSRYPNELTGYHLHADGKWKELEPYVSTKIDVNRVLGQPDSVFFSYGPDWRVIAFYFESASIDGRPYDVTLKGTLSSLKFYPIKRVTFANVVFPAVFNCNSLFASHSPASMTSCSDNTGLNYVFYDENSKDGKILKGDLNYIEYGVDDAKEAEYKKP
jgi:hypothetical protein